MFLGWSEWDVAPDVAKKKADEAKSNTKKDQKKPKKQSEPRKGYYRDEYGVIRKIPK